MKSNPINTELHSLKEELTSLRKSILIEMITEGVDDPGILKCVFTAGGPGCFVAGTLVKTSGGYVPIELLKEGMLVYTISEETGEIELKPILKHHIYTNHTEDLLELEFENGTIVRCTENHKFYVDGEWVCAKDLVVE